MLLGSPTLPAKRVAANTMLILSYLPQVVPDLKLISGTRGLMRLQQSKLRAWLALSDDCLIPALGWACAQKPVFSHDFEWLMRQRHLAEHLHDYRSVTAVASSLKPQSRWLFQVGLSAPMN